MPDNVIISADSHMTEPPDLWVTRIDKPFRDRAPRVVREYQGKPGHWFVCEGLEPRSVAGTFAAGKTPEELAAFQKAGYEAARPGGWDPAERLKDMAIDGVAAEVLYTTLGFRLFGLTDAPFQAAIFRAYNDWLAEFCRYDPKKFAGLALISLLEVDEGVREIRRCARLGLKGAMIMASPPERRDYSEPGYDPFWAAAQDLRMPLSLHTSTGHGRESRYNVNRYMRAMTLPHETQRTLTTLIFSGVLERFPALRIVSAENDIGWIAHYFCTGLISRPRSSVTPTRPRSSSCPAHISSGRSSPPSWTTRSGSPTGRSWAATTSCGRPTTRTRWRPGLTRAT